MSTAHRFRPETDRERAQLANAFVRYDPAEAGPQVQGVLEIVLFPALHAWEAAMAALSEAERALEARRMQLRDEDAAFGGQDLKDGALGAFALAGDDDDGIAFFDVGFHVCFKSEHFGCEGDDLHEILVA